MLSPQIIKQALRQKVPSRIYTRGVTYFQSGRVDGWSAKEDSGTINIVGEVEGSEIYNAVLEFDIVTQIFTSLECSCPYGSCCKHTVALGLTFADGLQKNPQGTHQVINGKITEVNSRVGLEVNEASVHLALNNLGLSADTLPQELVVQLLNYKKPKMVVQPKHVTDFLSEKNKKIKVFNVQDYYISLSSYNNYMPTLHEKEYFYSPPNVGEVMELEGITATQREVLSFINQDAIRTAQTPDLLKFLPLLVESGFPVYKSFSTSYGSKLKIEIKPLPLNAEVIYEAESMEEDAKRIRHNLFLRLPEIYWKGKNVWYDKAFFIQGANLLRETETSLELHQLTPAINTMLKHLEPVFDYNNNSHKVKYHQTRFTGEELEQFDRLAKDMSRLMSLVSAPPQFMPQVIKAKPQPTLAVNFDNTAQTLSVSPVMDYSIYKQKVGDSVYISRRGGTSFLSQKQPFEHPGSHIVRVENNVISLAKVEQKKEIELYKELSARAEEFGFSKTLKLQKKGTGQLGEYLSKSWPALLAHAKKSGYVVFFEKDELTNSRANFSADFTTEINADNDWLYFDVACYCAGERVTLEKLLAYLQSGQTFWQKQDGSLVEITNRPELERLARLLQSFHARENGGFEGKLYHVPELEYAMTSSPHYNSQRAKSFKEFLNRVENGRPVKKVRLPKELVKILRPYQKAGIEWLYFLRSYRFAGILADDMGLGKTLQTLAVLVLEKVSGKPSIVVCPKTLLYNWKLEVEKFFPGFKVAIYDGTPRERTEIMEKLKQQDLIIVSYGTLKKDHDKFEKFKLQFNYAVLDEAQFIKNHSTKNAQIVKKLNADYRLALTGTPLENSVSELWSIYDFLMPGFLGNYEHFAKNFHKPIMDRGDRQALEHLRRKVGSFMLRRVKSEVLKELPPKIEQMSQCHLSDAQNILYQQILAKVRGDVFDAVKQKGFKSAQIHILAGLTKLRQACNHPALLTKDKDFRNYESSKLDMCMELAEEVAEGRRKVLIFSQFTQMLDIVSAALKDRNIEHLYLSGKTRDRQSLVDKFNTDPAVTVFLISLKAGGTGLNLTAADTVIIFDPWWNPSVENQAVDRAHRIGQTKTLNVYRLLTVGTIEEKIQKLKEKKQLLFNALIGQSGDMFKKLTWDDVRELFAN